jgi:Na+-translocating ferredoxin:NAD+ oxidoreductase RnfC subunit
MKALDLLQSGGAGGGGGAGFPTWKKLSAPAETLLINGAECEPLLQSDQYLMLHQAQRLVRAALALGEIVGAAGIVIALKDHYVSQRVAVENAALGSGVSIRALPTVYPVGDEQSVVFECTGRVVPPGGLPGSVGCTVVSVSTALNALATLEGVPVIRRLVTVAGEVSRPGLYEVPVGTPVN